MAGFHLPMVGWFWLPTDSGPSEAPCVQKDAGFSGKKPVKGLRAILMWERIIGVTCNHASEHGMGFIMLDMQAGRPSKIPRTPFGERVFAARTTAGLSQAEVAEKLGITQASYADWERHVTALRPDQIEQLANILGVSVEELFTGNGRAKERGGPVGRAKRVFERVSKLPRSRQQYILKVVEDLVGSTNASVK